ncbi:MAG: hypothetical protein KJ561_05905 [Nanoarchaeota archaeon]|nr:hypothetical protein [Nanoarchaeota archaeon]
MLILIVPFVSAAFSLGNINVGNMFSSGKMFVSDNWDSKMIWVIVGLAFVVFVISKAKHNVSEARIAREAAGGGGALALGAGVLGAKVGWWGTKKLARGTWLIGGAPVRGIMWGIRRHRIGKNQVREQNQLELDSKIEKRVKGLNELDRRIEAEEKNLDQRLHKLEGLQVRLEYWEKKIVPYLTGVLERIRQIEGEIRVGTDKAFMNPNLLNERLQSLSGQYTKIINRHAALLERFRGLIRAEAKLIELKIADQEKENAIEGEEKVDEDAELSDTKRELKEVLYLYNAYREAGASPRDIDLQGQRADVLRKKYLELLRGRRRAKKEKTRDEVP